MYTSSFCMLIFKERDIYLLGKLLVSFFRPSAMKRMNWLSKKSSSTPLTLGKKGQKTEILCSRMSITIHNGILTHNHIWGPSKHIIRPDIWELYYNLLYRGTHRDTVKFSFVVSTFDMWYKCAREVFSRYEGDFLIYNQTHTIRLEGRKWTQVNKPNGLDVYVFHYTITYYVY